MWTEAENAESVGVSSCITAPLTDAQKQLWILAQRDDDASKAYNVPVVLRLRGGLRIGLLRQAMADVVARHEVLRTTITADGEQQEIAPSAAIDMPLEDLSDFEPDDRHHRLAEFLGRRVGRIFDLGRGPLYSVAIVKFEPEHHLLILVVHHIITDGWSMGVLVRDIAAAYTARVGGSILEKQPPLQMREYAQWLRQAADKPTMQSHEAYWLDHFAHPVPQLEIPRYKSRPPEITFRGARRSFSMSFALAQRLNEISQQNKATLFMTFLAGYMVLLHRLSGQDDLIVGTPIARRALKGGGELFGFCVNMIPIRGSLAADVTFDAYLSELRAALLDAYTHADYPYASLIKCLKLPRDPSRPLLVSTTFNLNAPVAASLRMPDLDIELVQPPIAYTQHELSLNIINFNDNITSFDKELLLELEYNTNLFDAATAERFANHLTSLYEAIADDPSQPVMNLKLLTDEERRTLLVEWNATDAAYPTDCCLHQCFEAQVEKTPDAIALVFDDQSLTYAEFNARANQLAHHLQRRGVGPDVPVGICMERSFEMVLGLYGILKAGGAYVPFDPDYPKDRLGYIMEGAGAPVVLTQSWLRERLPPTEAHVLALDQQWENIAQAPQSNPTNRCTPENLAYVIYTSGSTGRPKGVAIPHAGIVNRLLWMQDEYRLDTTDRVLQKTPFSFDVSVWEFFWPLMTGASLVVARPGGHRDSAYLVDLIAKAQITTLHFVPPMLAAFLEGPGVAACRSLRRVICSGEALPLELMQRHYERLAVPLHNLYGPTEASVDVTYWACERDTDLSTVPIGRPIANTKMYILDAALNPVPVGVAGELHIGGVNLARGYLNRPDLTAEKFIPDPFSKRPDDRLYKTGDLSRFLPDGNIEFLGRMDHQVKIRGFRIELGEIEGTLSQHQGVLQLAVIARADGPGERRLVGYVVPSADAVPEVSELRAYLHKTLPDYMVPAAFVFLDSLPLTPNGKVDREALPAPEARPTSGRECLPPRTPAEKALADIWVDVLGIKQISLNDNFFELGGDSILGMRIVARAGQSGLKLAPNQIFEHQTLASLAAVAQIVAVHEAEQNLVTGSVPLTPIQHWFFEANLPTPNHYNQSVILEARETLDPELLGAAFEQLLLHHDALRMRFSKHRSGWEQVIEKPAHAEVLTVVDLSRSTASRSTASRSTAQPATFKAADAQLQASLNVTRGPLVRAALFRFGNSQPERLLLVIHHLIVDAVSWQILLEDLATSYRQLQAGHPIGLPPKTTSFKAWAERLQAYAGSDEMRKEREHWVGATRKPTRPLPVDRLNGTNTVAAVRTVTTRLDAHSTQLLLKEAPAAYNTQINELLLTALALSVSTWTGAQALSVDVEGHGRETLFTDMDVTRTVGWFTSIFPVHLDLMGVDDNDLAYAIKTVKEQLRGIPNKGVGYGILRYLTDPTIRATLAASTKPQILFNYLGQYDYSLSQDAPFALTDEREGAEHSDDEPRRYWCEVIASVICGQLTLSWLYSKQLHRQETIETLAQNFMTTLQELIAHCLSPEAGGYTPSDFSDAELTQSDLDKILAEYER